jgi:hypothetical protein
MIAVSDAAGNFSLPATDPGVRLRARRGRLTTTRSVVVSDKNLSLVLERDAMASIRVLLQQPDGKPVAAARVGVTDTLGNEDFDERMTAADGTCLIKNLSPDLTYRINVSSAGFGFAEKNVQVQPGKLTEVSPIVLARADSFVAGMVVDESGNPIADIPIMMMGPHFATSFRTDVTGHFRHPGLVPGDRVSFSATKDDHTLTGSVKNVIAGTDNVVITIRPPAPTSQSR